MPIGCLSIPTVVSIFNGCLAGELELRRQLLIAMKFILWRRCDA